MLPGFFLKAIIHSRNAFAVSVKTICKRDKVKMRVEFELPDIGIETGDEVTLSFWHVEEDEEFVEGDDIMEVSTNKATFNIPAPHTGRLVEILVQEGDVVRAGDVIAIIETADY
jgi:pyruvate dehydrogenase E2 component (dihydrolipoamide acetyltransferase)